jgi:isopentenyl-diphosphate delta-isomerase
LTTVGSILAVREALLRVGFCLGGLRDGIDIATVHWLGASLGGMAGPFLRTAASSVEDTVELIEEIKCQIQFACCAGVALLRAWPERNKSHTMMCLWTQSLIAVYRPA